MGPQVPVHHASPNKLQKQIQRILEFVVDASAPYGGIHRSRQRRVNVGIYQEPDPEIVPENQTKAMDYKGKYTLAILRNARSRLQPLHPSFPEVQCS